MDNTMENGKIFGFNYSEKDLTNKIDQYKKLTEEGKILLPSWPDFCCYVDCDSDVLEDVMVQGVKMTGSVRSAYYARAMALKSMRRWCEAQLVSNPNWGGKMGVKSMMLLKQGFGGGRKYMDERSKVNGPSEITINFGNGDKRSGKARK